MTARLRLAWRLQRWELAFVGVGCLGLAAAAFWQTADMRSQLTGCGTPAAARACDLVFAFQDSNGQTVQLIQMAIAFVPFVAGLLLGVPIVAREVEHRTALVSWPLAGSRLKWLVWRLAPVLAISLLPMAVLGVAADQMAHAYFPNSDLGFGQYEARGLPLVMRFVVVFVASVASGAVLGRVLPALLVGIGMSVVLSMAVGWALPHWVPSTELTTAESAQSGAQPITTEVRYRTPDGRLVDAQAGEEMIGAAYEANGFNEPDPSTLPQEVDYGIAGNRYPEVVVRESAALGAVAISLGALAAFVVARRRPE